MLKHNVFVYGTLKKEKGYSYYLKESEFIGEAIVNGYTMVNLGSFPGAINTGEGIIHGELYKVDDKTLHQLDMLEGYRENNADYNFYTRELVEVIMKDNSIITAYMYTLPKSYLKHEKIENGIW